MNLRRTLPPSPPASGFALRSHPNTSSGLRSSDLGLRTFASGFTLVEILIAITILSLVLAAIYSSWTAILRASKVGRDAAAAVQRARVTGRTIEECLSSVQSFAANYPYYAFLSQNGSEASLSFVTRLGPSFPRSGKFGDLDVRRVTFSLEPSGDGGRSLVLRQQPLLLEMDRDEKNLPLVLAKHVKEFKTEFWDQRLREWIDEWKQTNAIPPVVKVTIKLADNQFSTQVREQVTRIVSLPSVTVQQGWQVPRLQPRPGMPGAPGAPGAPGSNPNPAAPGQVGNPGYQPTPNFPGGVRRP